MEQEQVSQTFSYTLTEEGAKFKSINIVSHDTNRGIIVKGASFSGQYLGVFTFGGEALRYRKGDDLLTASDWESLPPPREADLYLWQAPRDLRRTFKYTVELVYSVTTPGEPGSNQPPITSDKKITQVYTQDVVGNWSIWGEKLREYVNAGK